MLLQTVLTLLPQPVVGDHERWDAVQRASAEVCRHIEYAYWKRTNLARIHPGDASSPSLKASKVEPGLAARSEMARVQAIHLAATLGVEAPSMSHELETLVGSKYAYVRLFASEAYLAVSYARGSGAGFIKALLAFETAMVDVAIKRQTLSPVEPDDGPAPNLTVAPERWFGLLVAGAVCSGPNLSAHLEGWQNESSHELGADAGLTNAVRLIIKGVSRPVDTLEDTVMDTTNPREVRCGAAAKILLDMPIASKALQLHGFLASALLSDGSATLQELFNHHIARCFAKSWRAHAQDRFQFYSPSISVPALLSVLDDLEGGNGTLKDVLVAASAALKHPLGSIIEEVL
jgi:hypothetical protein